MKKLTKKQIQENFKKRCQEVVNRYCTTREEAFNKLQALSMQEGLPRFGSAFEMMKQLINTKHEGRAVYLYEQYITIDALYSQINSMWPDIIGQE